MSEQTDFLERVNIEKYYGEKYQAMVLQARALLKKCPPQKFLDKWSKLADEEFRANLTDNDAVVTMVVAITLNGGKEFPLYWCDDWQLLYELMVLKNVIPLKIE